MKSQIESVASEKQVCLFLHVDISVKKSSLRRILSVIIEGHIFLLATKIESQYTKAKMTISLFSVTMRFFLTNSTAIVGHRDRH